MKPSKSLSQNFLIDDNIAGKIVRLSGTHKGDTVLEIGPGNGALTTHLAESSKHVVAVEIDKRLIPELGNRFKNNSNVEIISGDILKLDISELLSLKSPNNNSNNNTCGFHVCANLPYGITTPIIIKLIEAKVFKTLTIMIQKEVAERICAKPGTPSFGAFSVFAAYHSITERLFDVPPECFSPRPKVTSTVIKMTLREEARLCAPDEKRFFKVVKAAFAQRRKTLINALYSVFGEKHSKIDIKGYLAACGLDEQIRGEKLSLSEFIQLSRNF